MGARVQVGILDSGADVMPKEACAFEASADGDICLAEPWPDHLRHGTIIAEAIVENARSADFLVAQIFRHRPTTTPAVVAAGLDWLVGKGAQIVTMSFGLRADRPVLREACRRAITAGVILVAASPARGGAVYPAAYPGVISVSGDARLQKGEISALGPDGHFGAYAWLEGTDETGRPRAGGASFAVATLASRAVLFFERTPGATRQEVIDYLAGQARFRGAERILGHGGPQNGGV